MILVRARYKSQMADITYDPISDGGVDVLELLVASMFENLAEPVLIDFAGRRINAPEDIDDIKVIELIPESLQGSVEEILEQEKDSTITSSSSSDWGQHDHLLKDCKQGSELIRGTTVVNIWVLDKEELALHKYCTSTMFSSISNHSDSDTNTTMVTKPIMPLNDDTSSTLQPVYRIVDTNFLLCTRCAQMVTPDLMQKGSDRLIKYSCHGKQVLDIGLGKYLTV